MLDYNRYKKCKNTYDNYIVILEYKAYIQLFDVDAYIIANILDVVDKIEIIDECQTLEFSVDMLKNIEEKLRKDGINYIIMRMDKNILTKVRFNVKSKYEELCQEAKINQYINSKRNANYEQKEISENIPNKFDDICFTCMKYRGNECFGGQVCDLYKKSPDVSKEEIKNWPEYGSATFYKLKGYHRNRK